MQSLAEVLQEKMASERLEFDASHKTLIHLVRTHYDAFTKELFPLLRSRGVSCYATVQEILRQAGKDVTIDAIKQAMKKVRQERSGSAFIGSSKRLGNNSPLQAGAGRGSRPDLTAVPVLAPQVSGEQSPRLSGSAGRLTWSMALNERGKYEVVFDGMAVPYKNAGVARAIMPSCTRLYSSGDRQGLLEALNFLKSYMGTFTGMPTMGEGLALKTVNWPQAEASLVVSIQNDIKNLGSI